MTDEHRFLLVCDDAPREVLLTDPGPQVLEVAQAVRRPTGPSLWRSQALATRIPAVVLGSAPREDAEAAVAALLGEGGQRCGSCRSGTASRTDGRHRDAAGKRERPAGTEKPPPREGPRAGGLFVGAYFFLPWFLTASIAAAAASGSRYVPPGLSGLKSASRS